MEINENDSFLFIVEIQPDKFTEKMNFTLKDDNQEFSIGISSVLKCIALAISSDVLPKLPKQWCEMVDEMYTTQYALNDDICYNSFNDVAKPAANDYSADCTILELNHKGKLSTRLCSALCRDYPRDNGIIKEVNDLTIANIILLGKDELLKTKGIDRTLYWELVTLLCKDFGENIENWKPNSNTNPYFCNLNKSKKRK